MKLRYVSRELSKGEEEGYLFTLFKNKPTVQFRDIPKFPSVKRDLAFVVDENLELDKLINALKDASGFIEKVELFDVYFLGAGEKSVAFSIEFRASDRSLSDEEVNREVERIVSKLKELFKGLRLRT